MKKKITLWFFAALEIGLVSFILWLWYYAALAANNYAHVEGFALPPLVKGFVWISRYRITAIIGLVFAVISILKVIRDTPVYHRAVALFLLGLLVISTVILTDFTMHIGSCLCDDWMQWTPKKHPTEITVPQETEPTSPPLSHDKIISACGLTVTLDNQ